MSLSYFIGKQIRKAIFNPTVKGTIGERIIEQKLNWVDFWGYRGVCLKNIYIPKKNGTTEIDLLYITVKGIYVIESKNYAGYIFGNENNKYWTATLYAGKDFWGRKKIEKHKFYNPIRQNWSHIDALIDYLGVEVPTYSIVSFDDRCELKDIILTSANVEVCYTSKIKSVIKRVWRLSDDVFSENDIKWLYQMLEPLTHASKEVKKQHIDQIYLQENATICPRCGANLVLRTARHGVYVGNQFWGCSNYPNCRYTKNLEN